MKSLNLNALHHFCEIVREGSLTKAAQKLNISAPTLSRHLAQLEEQVGHKLVHRHAKQFKLTIDGERYYNSLSDDFSQLQEQLSVGFVCGGGAAHTAQFGAAEIARHANVRGCRAELY